MIIEVACPIPVLKTFDYELPQSLGDFDPASLPGRRVRVPFGFRTAEGVICAVKETTGSPGMKLKSAIAVLDEEPVLSASMVSLGKWLSERYLCSPGEGLFALLPPAGKPSFQDSGFHHPDAARAGGSVELTQDQKAAASRLHDIVFAGEPRAVLLRGVAAAGKTEVYLAAIHDVLQTGRTVLYLVPEIGLAAQAADFLRSRFGADAVCLWHSDLPLKSRRENWWRVRRSEAQIVVGARSAALAPLDHIGLIVVDEEQDTAFKEERKPRFHARDVALHRALENRAVALFGTATPSLELYLKTQTGEAELIELNERAVAAGAPAMKLVDLKAERARGSLSPTLQAAMAACLGRHEQAILFLNRRGFHRFLRCPNCAWVARCEKCGVSLVHHKGAAAQAVAPTAIEVAKRKKGMKTLSGGLSCHICGLKTGIPTSCPECKHGKLHAGGTGTERLAEDVMEAFPWARVLRWDSDTAAKAGGHEGIYRDFAEGKADVLIGTQVVAQGFNFPKVTLVGVVDADVPLYLPDFRAAERAFQHVMQVGGRAGREMVTGDVIIQTRHADHYALSYAARMDHRGFAEAELRFREDLNYPPYSHIVRVRTDARDLKRAEDDMNRLITWLTRDDSDFLVGVLGPTPVRATGAAARQLQCLVKIPSALRDPFLAAFRGFLGEKGGRFWIDVDPETVF